MAVDEDVEIDGGGDNRPSAYWEVGTGDDGVEEVERAIIRGSALGGCTAALAYGLKGVTKTAPPGFMQRAFDEGHRMEEELIQRGLEKAKMVEHSMWQDQWSKHPGGQIELELVWGKGGNRVVRLHPDGVAMLLEGNGGLYVVEAKFVGPQINAKLKRGIENYPQYSWQVACEMLATGMPCLLIVGEKDPKTRELVDVWVKVIDTPPHSLADVKARVAKVVGMASRRENPVCDVAMFPCGYFQLHDTETEGGVWWKGAPVAVEGDEGRELRKVVEEIERARGQEADGKAEKERLLVLYRALTVDLEGAREGGKVVASGLEFTHVVQAGSSRTAWQKVALEAEVPATIIAKHTTTTAGSVYPKLGNKKGQN